MEHANIQWIISWEEVLSPQMQILWMQYYEAAFNASVFSHPSMGTMWLTAYRPLRDIKPFFCVGEIDGIRFFYPLVKWRRNWKNVFQQIIVPVGFSDFDYLEPLIIKDENLTVDVDFYNHLSKVLIKKAQVDLVEFNGLRDAGESDNSSHFHYHEICPLLHLDKFRDFPEFMKSLKTSLRGDLNRQQRRLSEIGNVELKIYLPSELDEIKKELPYLLEYHRLRFPYFYVARGFHEQLVDAALSAGILHFSTLNISGKPVSWHLGFSEKDVFYYYLPAMDPEYSNYSVGKIHLLELNKWAIEQGVILFDHLRGDENYKSGWTDSYRKIYRVKQSNPSPISAFRNFWVNFKSKF